jgi:hypothetical protein
METERTCVPGCAVELKPSLVAVPFAGVTRFGEVSRETPARAEPGPAAPAMSVLQLPDLSARKATLSLGTPRRHADTPIRRHVSPRPPCEFSPLQFVGNDFLVTWMLFGR